MFDFVNWPYILIFYIGMDHPVATKHRLAIASATKYTKIEKYMKIPGRLKYHHRSKKNTKPSPTHYQHIAAPSPYITEFFTETYPRCHQDITGKIPKTSPKNQQNNIKTTPRHHQKNRNKTKHQDMTETAPGYYQNNTETLQQQNLDITKKRQRHDREITEISPK